MRTRAAAALLLLALLACGRKEQPVAASVQEPVPLPVVEAWSWHPIGPLAVIEGEVALPTELLLEGRSIRERRFAEPGPVRWELFRPPEGEEAVLRTTEGVELARFTFSVQAPRPAPEAATPRMARRPAPPPAPKTRVEAQLRNAPPPSLPDRTSPPLPSVSQAPRELPPGPSGATARTRVETRLYGSHVPSLPDRSSPPLPSVSQVPRDLPPPASGASARTKVETRLPGTQVQPLPDRSSPPLPGVSQVPRDLPPAPTGSAARAKVETRLPGTQVQPLPDRSAPQLPGVSQVPRELPPPASGASARTKVETRLYGTHVPALPDRAAPHLPGVSQVPTELPPGPSGASARTKVETRLSGTRVPALPDRAAPQLPGVSQVPTELPPGPSGSSARTKVETRISGTHVPALPDRTAPQLPGVSRVPTELPPGPSGSSARTRTESQLRSASIAPLPDRRGAALPSASLAPGDVPHRGSTIAPLLVEPVLPRTPRPLLPAAPVTPAAPWPGMGEALNLTRGPGGHKRILLSFDGGSNAQVATEVLDLLKARGVRTTLFLTGAFIKRFPALVRRMAADGHELGNHTMNHPHFAPGMKRDPKWTRERVQQELLAADAALVALLGRPMDPFWRAPYGEHTAEIRRWAEELGYRHVGWSEGADTLDWATPKDRRLYRSGEAIVKRLETRLNRDGDGLIVLMHLGSERTSGDRPTDGLGAFMDRARQEGWTFVSAGSFLRDLGKPAWDPQQRLALLGGTR